MRIERPSKGDYPVIADLWEASVRATHDFLTDEEINAAKPRILGEYLESLDLRCVKSKSGESRGALGVADESIDFLFIHPRHFGTGIGKALVAHAVDQLGARKLDVYEQNPAARSFYEHLGFIVVGRSAQDGQGKPYPLLHMELTRPDRGEHPR